MSDLFSTGSEEWYDIFDPLGGNFSDDVILGAKVDFIKPFRIFAIVIFIVVLADLVAPYIIEPFRLREMHIEMRDIIQSASDSAELRFQETDPFEYMYEHGSTNPDYEDYLEFLYDEAYGRDAGMTYVAVMLGAYTPSGELQAMQSQATANGQVYTPLNFDLAYLDEDMLNDYFKEDVNMLSDAVLNSGFADGERDFSTILQELTLSENRFKVNQASMQVNNMYMLNISDIDNADQFTQDVYASIYGNVEQESSMSIGQGLTTDKHIVVYDITYKIKWTAYAGTNFLRRPDDSRLTPDWLVGTGETYRNEDGFCQFPEQTTELRKLYYITN